MKIFARDLNDEIAIVAEIGVNHEGDPEVAEALVRHAAEAGADAVKFQSYTPERFIAATDAERFARVSRFALDEATHRRLAEVAADAGIVFFSTPVTEDWVPLLDELCPAFKIASGDLTFAPVIRAAARTGKPVIMSTGNGTVEEIDRAVGWIGEEIGESNLAGRLVLMHCVSAYPTPIEEANLRSIPYLAERYGLAVGWSNHVLGPEACLAATALGARVLEVHVTDRKEGREFRDHAMSFEPTELAELVTKARLVRRGLGAFEKKPMPCEAPVRDAMRKGVVAARDLASGATLAEADLMYARPASEFPAEALPTLIGRRLKRAVGRGKPIGRDAMAEERG